MGRITRAGPARSRAGRGPVAEETARRTTSRPPSAEVAHARPAAARHVRGDRARLPVRLADVPAAVPARRAACRRAGPVLLVANHVSILDPIACARLVFDAGRLPHFLAKESVFKGFAGTLLRSAGQIPVARFSADAHAALDAAKADLDAGNVVVIYPEGSVTRDPDWWPMQARTGVARLALTTDAVVVPVAQWGPQRVHDYHRKKLRLRFRAPADYLVGEPVDLSAQRAAGARRRARCPPSCCGRPPT